MVGVSGIAGAVEGLQHDHAVGVGDVAATEGCAGPWPRWAPRPDRAVNEPDHRRGEDDEDDADASQKEHVVEAGAPHGLLGAFGMAARPDSGRPAWRRHCSVPTPAG